MTEQWRRRIGDVAELVVWSTRMKPPTLGTGRLICIDGGAGSGKSTLSEAVLEVAATESVTTAVVHLDDLLDGWGGLHQVAGTLGRDVLTPLRGGRPGRYRRYDWHRACFADEVDVEPADLLVVEGVGSGSASHASSITTLVWVDAPPELRLARGLARDGEAMRSQWLQWMADEDEVFRRERTRDRADMVVGGTGEAEQSVVLG